MGFGCRYEVFLGIELAQGSIKFRRKRGSGVWEQGTLTTAYSRLEIFNDMSVPFCFKQKGTNILVYVLKC